jgi:hypothetical protein
MDMRFGTWNVRSLYRPGSLKAVSGIIRKGMKMLTTLFNSILRTGIFPDQRKVAQIILIPKPGKNHEEITSYRPISLLAIMSKLFEKILLQKLKPILIEQKLIPNHQFGFRQEHATIEQVHRIVNKTNQDLRLKRYCSAAFLDISQAFDKVWHTGLLFKIKRDLPYNYYQILKPYLSDRYFYVRYQEEQTPLIPIESGVPQGSVLGPVLYILYTADLPTLRQTTAATFEDDSAVVASHSDPQIASNLLHKNLNKIQNWLKIW